MHRNISRLVIAVSLIIAGVALLFISAHRKSTIERYQPTEAVIKDIKFKVTAMGGGQTTLVYSYSVGGQTYSRETREHFYYTTPSVGQVLTLYYLDNAPEKAISKIRLEQLIKIAPVLGYIGWGLIGAAVLTVLWHGTDMLPIGRRSSTDEQRPNPLFTGQIEVYQSEPAYDPRPEIGLKYLFGRRKYRSRTETSHAKSTRVEIPEDKDHLVQDIQNDPRGPGILRL